MNQNKLEIFNSNIIKWYPFEKDKEILQIGTNQYITRELEKKAKSINAIQDIQDLKENKKYDYILIYGSQNMENIIEKIVPILNTDGKILIIGNNDFGINNWSKYDKEGNKKGVIGLQNNNKIKTIKNIEDELHKNNFTEINTFFVFPDYKTTELVVNQNLKIEDYIDNYNPNIFENEIKVFDEIKVLKNILTNDPDSINFFANSYFIEVSKVKINNDIRYVSFNNCRKEQYQLMTVIKDDIVEKLPATEKANKHTQNMIETIKNIKEENIEILDYEVDGKIYSKLIKNEKTLDKILALEDDIEKIAQILNEYKNSLQENSLKYEECKDNIKNESLQKLHFLEKGYWDMIPKNCFYIDNKFIFFDQEWEESYLPVEFILYRAIINSYDLVRKINVDELLEKMEILQYKEVFEKMDNRLREKILDQEVYEIMYNKNNLKAIDNLINENKLYINELNKKEEYIQKIEKYMNDLREDNINKQKYIEILEENMKKKSRKKFF